MKKKEAIIILTLFIVIVFGILSFNVFSNKTKEDTNKDEMFAIFVEKDNNVYEKKDRYPNANNYKLNYDLTKCIVDGSEIELDNSIIVFKKNSSKNELIISTTKPIKCKLYFEKK